MKNVTAVIATTSGHTQFVIDTVVSRWKETHDDIAVRIVRAETATVEDLTQCDVLLLGSGTWNTGGVEGQLNPYMHELLFEKLKGIDLQAKPVLLVSLGDERYYFTTRCTERFMQFLKAANGKSAGMPLIIVNEPYDQTEKIKKWADGASAKMLGA